MLASNARQALIAMTVGSVAVDADALIVSLASGVQFLVCRLTHRQFFLLVEQHHAHHLIAVHGLENAFHESVLALTLRELANLFHQIRRVLPLQIRHFQKLAAFLWSVAVGTHCCDFLAEAVQPLTQFRVALGLLQTRLQRCLGDRLLGVAASHGPWCKQRQRGNQCGFQAQMPWNT